MSRAWMPIYVGDYLSNTRHLTTVEHGAYILLILHYWENGELPPDEKRIKRITGLTNPQWCRSRNTLAAFFEHPGWKHGRIEMELQKCKKMSVSEHQKTSRLRPNFPNENNGKFLDNHSHKRERENSIKSYSLSLSEHPPEKQVSEEEQRRAEWDRSCRRPNGKGQ